VKTYVDPADPALINESITGFTSYAANAQVFRGKPNLPRTFADGTSTTIAFAQHYAFITKERSRTFFDWASTRTYKAISPDGHFDTVRRATFADYNPKEGPYDAAINDVYPVTANSISVGSIKELTFQVRPRMPEADPRITQSPHVGGMLIAMADGSVHQLRAGLQPTAYWALVTPAGGEVISDDW
jgi:hypothetical protein